MRSTTLGGSALQGKRINEQNQKKWAEKIVEGVVLHVSRNVYTSPHIVFSSVMPVAYKQIQASGTNTFERGLNTGTV